MLRRLFWKSRLSKVFTPGTVATLTYVNRIAVENDFEKFVHTPGIQIVLYGYSGSGKSTLNENILTKEKLKFLPSRCQSNTTMNDLILDAFDQLNVYYNSEHKRTTKNQISSQLVAKYAEIGAKLNASESIENTITKTRILPIQLSPQRLAEFMGAAECIWVIEDFHKVAESEKKLIADILKIFVDTANKYPKTKVICIGAVATAREMIELDSNLSNRVAEIPVPLMKDDDLKQIVIKGSYLMNLSISTEIVDKIVYYSNNLGLICHQICYDLCHNRNIKKTRFSKAFISESDFKDAVNSHIRKQSDTYNKIYDKINCTTIGITILTAILNVDKEFFTITDFHKEIKKIGGVSKANAEDILCKFLGSEYDEIIRLDKHSKKYSFSNPFFHSYFKMKIALLEHEKNNGKKKNRINYRLESEVTIEFLWNDKLFKEYYQIMEHSFNRKLEYYNKERILVDKKLEIENKKRNTIRGGKSGS